MRYSPTSSSASLLCSVAGVAVTVVSWQCHAHSGWVSASKTSSSTSHGGDGGDGGDVHNELDQGAANLEAHPDPNDENYKGMVYVGRHDPVTGKRIGFGFGNTNTDTDTDTDADADAIVDNAVRYIFGTSFDETHRDFEERDLELHPLTPVHDLPDLDREALLHERRHKPVSDSGPKRYGHAETHALDGGITPPKVVHVDPFFLDATLVTNKDFGKFVRATYYETEAEKYGWSFVLSSFVDPSTTDVEEADPEAPDWVAVPGAYWRRPEGPQSTYKHREYHPVVHVTHRDAAEYCEWLGKRLPGEWEWEAAARAGHYGPANRTLYAWGDEEDWETAGQYANLWGPGAFPDENQAADGWRATNPVTHFPPNKLGFYDTTGNVWEWQRGGKHKARIVRGASYVDSLKGDVNHAATLGARENLHGTTSTANVGFRCAKAPKRRAEYHFVRHDEESQQRQGQLAIEDQFGKRDLIPQRGWEDQFPLLVDEFDQDEYEDDNMSDDVMVTAQKKRVIKRRERFSNEL